MHIAIVGPIATSDIAPLIGGRVAGLPAGYSGAPLLATLIAELLARGHRITAITTSVGMPLDWQQPIRVAEGNLQVIYVPMRAHAWRPNGWWPGRIVDLFAFERRGLEYAIQLVAPDIVHAHWSYEFAWAAQSSRHPTLVTCHDAPLLVAKMYSFSKPTQSAFRWLRLLMARRVLRHATHVTAVSDYLREAIQPLCKCAVDVVPNPLPDDVGKYLVGQRPLPDTQAPILGMVANGWGRLKNPVPALRSFASLRKRKSGARLRLYGTDFGPGERAERWARKQQIAEGMEFVGRVPHAELLKGVAGFDVLIHPSLEETFGMSIAEAMALGVPVVGGKASGAVPWVVGDGGILVDVMSAAAIERALVELLDDPIRYRAVSCEARARCRDFAQDKVVDSYESIYRAVLQ